MSNAIVTGHKLVANGKCLAKSENGEIFFVDGLLVGEKAKIDIIFEKSKVKFGEISELITTSNERVSPPCPHVEHGCGGCDWQHIEIGAQAKYKREIFIDSLTRIAKLIDATDYVKETIQLDPRNYRVTVRPLFSDGTWGYRKQLSHEFIPVNDCLVLTRTLQNEVEDKARKYNKSQYKEFTVREKKFNFLNQALEISSKSFVQSHKNAPEEMAKILLDSISDLGNNLSCVDLYSGIGIFAIALAKAGHKVVGIEGNSSAVKDAIKNAENLEIEFINSDINDLDQIDLPNTVDVLVIDPSRAGIGTHAIEKILKIKAKRIILISCDPAAGARDIKLLCEKQYMLEKCLPIDMFGFTHHLEVISILNIT